MEAKAVVDCSCGGSFVATQEWCNQHKSAVVECPGKTKGCTKTYSAVTMLKAMERKVHWTSEQLDAIHESTGESA